MSKLVSVVFVILYLSCIHSTSDFTVARDGSGKFSQISEAIKQIPAHSKIRLTIRVKAGVYDPFVVPRDKPNISLLGDGIDKTIVNGNKSYGAGSKSLSETATVQILGAGFLAQGLTINNSAGPSMAQAVALLVEADNVVFYRCAFNGYQDTLYMKHGVQFYRECKIYGTTDFIFGSPRVVLQNSEIFLHQPLQGHSNVITAENTNSPKDNTGIVLHNCTIKAASDFSNRSGVKTFLGRPWGNYSTTIIMQSYLPDFIDAGGWMDWNNATYYIREQVTYREYKNWGPGAATGKRVNWKGFAVIINILEAEKYTVKEFLGGGAWIASTNVPFYPGLYP